MIRHDGKIVLPLIGDIVAATSTPAQLEVTIAFRLAKYVNQPQVRVTLVNTIRQKYYVDGSVSHPGGFLRDREITVLEAIDESGGFDRHANPNAIVVLRGSDSIKLKYKRLLKDPEENIKVEDGDHIIIR